MKYFFAFFLFPSLRLGMLCRGSASPYLDIALIVTVRDILLRITPDVFKDLTYTG